MIIQEGRGRPGEKFQYLNNYLKGAAANKIKGLAETPENYDKALDLLKKTYGNEEEVRNLYQQKLCQLERVYDNLSNLSYFQTQLEIGLRSLEGLGHDPKGDATLLTLLAEKLPPFLRKHYE